MYLLNLPRVFAAIPGTTLHAQGQAFLGSSPGGSCQDLASITSKFVIGFRTNLAVQSQAVLCGPKISTKDGAHVLASAQLLTPPAAAVAASTLAIGTASAGSWVSRNGFFFAAEPKRTHRACSWRWSSAGHVSEPPRTPARFAQGWGAEHPGCLDIGTRRAVSRWRGRDHVQAYIIHTYVHTYTCTHAPVCVFMCVCS